MSELEDKKKALVAESEVYREMLKLEIQNLQLCAIRARRKVSILGASGSLLTIGAPLAGLFLGKGRRGSVMGIVKAALIGWRLYRKIGPVFGPLFAKRNRRAETRSEDRTPAANI
ncbi:MAG: hypothetical protein QOJ40_1052 [Verrucomicrobiota bacterium]